MLSVRILVIDDEPGVAKALAWLLSRDGYTVDTAKNGSCALILLQTHRYDVLLCDLLMPEMDGQGFYATLTQQHGHLRQRVIFLTGDAMGADSTAFLQQCGQPWLIKPCNAATVRSAIQQMLQGTDASREHLSFPNTHIMRD
jgi:CheY-like chemotaxis protein